MPADTRRQGRLRKVLSLDEKLDICEKVLIDHQKHREVAKEHRVRPGRVANLMHKLKRQPKLLTELFDVRLSKQSIKK